MSSWKCLNMSAAPPERKTLPPGVTAGGSAAQSLQRRLHILKIAPTMLPNAITKMAALNRGRMAARRLAP